MKTLLIALIAMASIPSFAMKRIINGQENEGAAYRAKTLWICTSEDGADGVSIIQTYDLSLMADYWTETTGGGILKDSYPVAQRPFKKGRMGQPLVFAGKKLVLSIGATTAPTSQGFYSNLTVDDLNVDQETVYCQSGDQE